MVRLKESQRTQIYQTSPRFQFHYGTIKSSPDFVGRKEKRKFQFHYGTIKRTDMSFLATFSNRFQFHYGTIKRKNYLLLCCFIANFNSTMVRLKVT